MANHSTDNQEEDRFRQLRYLPPLPPRPSYPSRTANNRYPTAGGSGLQSYPNLCQSSSEPFFVRAGPGQQEHGDYSMRYADGSADNMGHYSGSTATQPSPWNISLRTLSPFNTTATAGSRLGQEYPTTLHAPRPIHPLDTIPMQLEYILNRPRRSSASSPLSGLTSNQESASHFGSPTLPDVSSSRQGDTSGSDAQPLPPAASTSDTENGNKNGNGNGNGNGSQTPPQVTVNTAQIPAPSEIRTEFEEITPHTAKCDLCNSRNDSGMSRCLSCGWQSCHPCAVTNGCSRTHTAGSRVHTGPIDRNQLVSTGGLSKGNKRSRARPPKRDEEDDGDDDARTKSSARPTRRCKRQGEKGRRSQKMDEGQRASSLGTSTPTNPASPPTNEGSSSPTITVTADDLSETEKMLQGSRDFFAFSIEAWGVWAHEQRKSQLGQQPNIVVRSYQVPVGIEDLHLYAQGKATRALGEYRRNEQR